jgi:glycerol-3-phosphate dehydrogenase
MARGRVDGVVVRDEESGEEIRLGARAVINATGAFADGIRTLVASTADPMIAPSQGAHVVLDRSFLPGSTALMVPRVGDGRVMFAIPWRSHTLVGTTDTPIPAPLLEPRALRDEVDFLLRTAGRYLRRPPSMADVRSVFAGVRPLIRRGETRITAALSRDHTIDVDASGLITTTGGKWTTYRHMAEQTVDRAVAVAGLPSRPAVTLGLHVHGFDVNAERHGHLSTYGSDAAAIQQLAQERAELGRTLDPDLPSTGAEVVWAARHEMARTVEDVLARRARALFLNARAAMRMAPAVAALLARELRQDERWQRRQIEQFNLVAKGYTADAMENGRW